MLAFALSLSLSVLGAEEAPGVEDYLGRWDVDLLDTGTTFNACWWKVGRSFDGKLNASAVIRWGSVVPAKRVEIEGGELRIILPDGKGETVCRSRLEGEKLVGTVQNPDGKTFRCEGWRAPDLSKARVKMWGKPVALFDGKTLSGWKRRNGKKPSWEVKDGVLTCIPEGENDLVSEKTFLNFQLHLEYRLEKGSNSGVYLRGRYEIQLNDDQGRAPGDHGNGAIYSRIAPAKNVARPAGEWNVLDVTLVGRTVTIILNDEPIIENGYLDGITGGAFPTSREGLPGPTLLQGDHGKASFRNIVVTPAAAESEGAKKEKEEE